MRQAVVLIHGIGEPRPMTTLRKFVEGLLTGEIGLGATVRSKPDRLSESYELRRLVASQTRSRPRTDFFEFYWAHHMEGNTVRHVWPLVKVLLIRFPWRVPVPLLAPWTISWILVISAVYVAVGLATADAAGDWRSSIPFASALTTLVLGFLQLQISNYLGDAARYLSPVPENVSIRQKIRAEGIDVVKRIQNGGNYDRIVIVGHSLGSVIGYDIITHLWDQCNTKHAFPDRPQQKVLKRIQSVGRTLTSRGDDLTAFRDLQRALWIEQRALENPWLVTDFVTIGSPLTHAAILFTRDDEELQRRQADRELPTCPPVTDKGKYAYGRKYNVEGQRRTVRVLHHAAPFAVTRWTNIYVPLKAGLLGDWIGGPLQRVFGFGIHDVALRGAAMRFVPLLAHTRYWRARPDSPSLAELRNALALNSRAWLPSGPRDDSEDADGAEELEIDGSSMPAPGPGSEARPRVSGS